MKLYYSPTSPYVRKVCAVAIECGIELDRETVDPHAKTPDYGRINPINRVPALRLDDGSMLYDSPVICEYLDWLAPGKHLFPAPGPARWQALKLQAMGDGILDAAVPRRMEGLRPASLQSPDALWAYQRSINQTLDALEAEAGALAGVSIGTLAVACALGYLDFRFAADDWRKTRPKLAKWHAEIAKRPSIRDTAPPG